MNQIVALISQLLTHNYPKGLKSILDVSNMQDFRYKPRHSNFSTYKDLFRKKL